MIDRRSVIHGSLFAGLAAFIPGQSRVTSQTNNDDPIVAKAVSDLNDTIQKGIAVSTELARIREQQRIFLRANQKFPDVIEIGINVWESVYDWHVRHQQPLSVTRTAEGRYAMTVGFTTLLLRPDFVENYVGVGMDVAR
jgi:hypothetical protein